MTLSVRMMFRKKPLDNITYLISELNNISQLASQRAISGNCIVRLQIKAKPSGGMIVNLDEQKLEENALFKPVTDLFVTVKLDIDSKITVKQFFSEAENDGVLSPKLNNEIITFFLPSGSCEPLSIILRKEYENGGGVVEQAIVLNRLLCRFENKA